MTRLAISAAIGAISLVLTGCASSVDGHKQSQASDLPQDAKDFIKAYKDRFSDPLAVYYSEEAWLEKNPGQNLTIGPDYFKSYEMGATPAAATSPLGFPLLEFKPGTEVNEQNSISQFNESIPAMDRLMNTLAKNPLPEQTSVVEDEFVQYSGFNNSDAPALAQELATVVQKHGSNAVYHINIATADTSANTATNSIFLIPKPAIDDLDASGQIDAFNNPINLSISIESYNDTDKMTPTTEVISDLKFTVMRAKNGDPNNVGIIGIGAK